MRRALQVLLFLFLIITIVIAFNYKKLNLIAGYAAKNMASSVFMAQRNFMFTDTTDTNFSPVNIAKNKADYKEKSVTSSVLGLLKRKSIYRKGVGSVLVGEDESKVSYAKPNRTQRINTSYFPYGNKIPKDSVFTSVNYKVLQIAINTLFADKNKTRALVVIHKDKIIAEEYANGFDESSLLLGWSMAKSVLGTLFGVLHYQNKIDVQDKTDIQSWQNDERKNITIHNLLQMNSGLEWDESYTTISDVTKMLYLEEDMSKSQENKPLIGRPNESWNYSSGASNLLSGILRNQFDTYQEYLDFPYTNLIDKIGMHSMILETDLAGNYIASSYGWATARDWAKLGLLYLHDGNWNGQQIFDKEWVKYATTATPTSNGEYGASIWLNEENFFPDLPKNIYYFRGYQGQFVFVLPDHDTVIVRLGLVKDFAIMNDFVKEVIKAVE